MPEILVTKAEEMAVRASAYPAFRGFSLDKLKAELAEALQHFGRLGIFEEYTKHDISHVNGLLQVLDWLVPPETASRMSPADWLLAVLSAYLHDFGLLVTRAEYDRRESSEFRCYRGQFGGQLSGQRDLDVYLKSLSADESERFQYQEFVRYNHAKRVKGWISGKPDPTLGFDPDVVHRFDSLLGSLDLTFRNDLALVCESHHLDDIDDVQRYPIDRPYGNSVEETANVQYAAILLRASDLLHISRDRTPAVAFAVINPVNPVSQVEWAKQNAVRRVRPQRGLDADGNVSSEAPTDTIEVFASFSNAEGFFGLTNYLQYASRQLSECFKWASESNRKLDVPHKFPWRKIDSDGVEATGFIARPFEFEIDQHKILDLLTGHTLYNDTGVVLRELVQNSIDAVRLARQQDSVDVYVPRVEIEWNSVERVLTVTDNGTGMSQEVIESNFLRAGSSRYQDPKFVKRNPNFSPISRFGIGVLSAFMIGDDIDVLTVSEDEGEARHLTLRSVHGKYLIRLLSKDNAEIPSAIRGGGTRINLRLRDGAQLKDVARTLAYWIVIPDCAVTVSIDGESPISVGFKSVSDALRSALVKSGRVLQSPEVAGGLTGRSGRPVQIREVESRGVHLAYAVEWNAWFNQWEFFFIGDATTKPALGGCVEGIRVSSFTPGYQQFAFWALSNSVGANAPKTNVARNSFEATQENANYLRTIYSLYAAHVSQEVQEMSVRGLSVSKASSEASFIASRLVDFEGVARTPTVIEAVELLMEELGSIAAYLVESGGKRISLSLNGLAAYDHLYTIESSLVRHLEYVLSAISNDASYSKILTSISANAGVLDRLDPLYCVNRVGGLFVSLFLATWNPLSIEISSTEKAVTAKWIPASRQQLWLQDESALPTMARAISEPVGPWLKNPLSIPTSLEHEVQYGGVDGYTGVKLMGRTFLFPENPLVRLAVGEDANSIDKSRASVIFALARHSREAKRNDERGLEAAVDRTLYNYACEAGLGGEDFSRDVLLAALTDWNKNIFDSARWERVRISEVF